MKKIGVLSVLVAALATSLSASAQIVTDGDFTANAAGFTQDYGYSSQSQGVYVNAGYYTYNLNPSAPAGWTGSGNFGVESNPGTITDSTYNAFAPSGYGGIIGDPASFAFLQSNGAGASLSETLTGLTAGTTYQLSFAYAERSGDSGALGNISVTNTTLSLTGVPVLTVQNADFVTSSFDFVATASGNSVLTLANLQTIGDTTVDFSNISITALPVVAPEPSTYALLGLGALVLVWVRRRNLAKV